MKAGDGGNATCPARLPEGACDAHFANGRRHACQKIVYDQFKIPNGNGWFAEVPVNLPENLKRVSPGRIAEGVGLVPTKSTLLTSKCSGYNSPAWEAGPSHSAPKTEGPALMTPEPAGPL